MNDYLEELMNRFRETFGIKTEEKEYKPKDPYQNRKKYIKHTIIFVGLILVGMIGPLFMTHNNRYAIPQTFGSNNITQNATIKKVKSNYNPDTHLMVSEFFIGDQNDIDNASEDRNLANIKYDVKYLIQNNKNQRYPTKIVRVNDHYIVVITENVTPGYGLLTYNITPQKIKSALNTDCENSTLAFYIKEGQVPEKTNLSIHESQFYEQNYKDFALRNYQQKLIKLAKKIKEKENIITEDNKLLAKLNDKLESALKQNKSDLQDQIQDTEGDIAEQNKEIKSLKKEITDYQDRINHVTITN
ncbi:hypothetical protein JF75_05520 [Lactobacillus kimbladii]|uniref:Uncharacterized protein n=1 Tax=Lactobacillus kimbladii TaxID=1218506 RepID=A0A0F4LJR6_9LACO|nr:hypothetical protein [Lactobacillus kimbladii]KJY59092.1 hypothetical protein JF75_05520 [Lactobacillus kimbladii]